MPQRNYSFPDALARRGAPAVASASLYDEVGTYRRELKRDTYTVAPSTTPSNGVYSFTVRDKDGNDVVVSFMADSSTQQNIADGWVLAAEDKDSLHNVASFVAGTNLITVMSLHPGIGLVLGNATAPETESVTITQTVDGDAESLLGVGLAVAADGVGKVRPLASGDDASDIIGVTRLSDVHLKGNTGVATDTDGYPLGEVVPVARQSDGMWVPVEEAVDIGDPVYVRTVAAGAEEAGAFRKSPDGAAQVSTFTPTATNLAIYGFEFGYLGQHYTAFAHGDGSTTVAQAVLNLIQSIGTIAGITAAPVSTTHGTITTAAGTKLDYIRSNVSQADTPADSVDVVAGAATVDAYRWEKAEFASKTTGAGIAQLRFRA